MSMKIFLLVLVIAATAYSQSASDFDFTGYRGCVRRLFEGICTNNIAFYEDLLEIMVNCGESDRARLVSNYCARDEGADLYCGAAEAYPALIGTTSIYCGSAIQGGNCSDECRNGLMDIHSSLGCCTNAFYNNTGLYAIFAPVLSYPLWSSCGVDPPDNTCDGALPYTLPATPQRTCTLDEIHACRKVDTDVIRNAVPEGCEAITQYNMARCSHMDASDDGLCFAGLGTDTGVTIPSIISDCATAVTQSCSSSCNETLENFVVSRGCCVNTLYNSTFSTVTGLSSSIPTFQNRMLFDVCGVEAPPLTCPDVTPTMGTDGSLPFKSFTLMMLLPLIITALLGNKI